jgi:ABC-2 type transport system ATP-binding protein
LLESQNPPTREAIIEVKRLSKSFDESALLVDVSFNIYKGSFTTILGLNGVGKSTLLNILCCRVNADDVDGSLLGLPLGNDIGELREGIGLVSEHLNYELGSSVREFSRYYSELYRNFNYDLFRRLIDLRRLDLSKHFSQFSRGQRMQFSLILAMCQGPKILFMDEITSVLDYKAREFFLQELKTYTMNGGTIVLTTNIINEVQQYSTDLVVIRSPHEVLWGKQDEILARFVKIKLVEMNDIPELVREKALYLGRDFEQCHLLLFQREDWNQVDPRQVVNGEVQHPNLHEVFSWLTQQS